MKVFVTNPDTGNVAVVDSASALRVSVLSASAVTVVSMPAVGGGVEYAEGESAPSPTGSLVQWWANATSIATTVSNANPLPVASASAVTIASMPAVGGGVEYAEGESAPSPTGSIIQYWADSTSVARVVSPTNPLPTMAQGVSSVSVVNVVTVANGVSSVSVVNAVTMANGVSSVSVVNLQQFSEGEVATAPTGNAIMWAASGSVMRTVSADNPLPTSAQGVSSVSVVNVVTVANGVSSVSVVNSVTVANGVSSVSVVNTPTVVQGASGIQGWGVKLVDATSASIAEVLPASTAALATDNPLVVALHPSSPLPVGTGAIGSVTAVQGTAANLQATVTPAAASFSVVQATPANLNAQVAQGASGASQWSVGGGVAHDAVDAGNPVKIGGYATDTERTAVAAGDRVDAWFDQKGRLVVAQWHGDETTPVVFTYSSASSATVIATPGAGQSLWICSLLVSNTSGTLTRVDYQDGAAGTVRVTGAAAASGGGFMWAPMRPWKLTANTGLAMQLGTAVTDIRTTCEYFTAP